MHPEDKSLPETIESGLHFLRIQMFVNSNSTLNFHSDHCISTQNIYWVNISNIYKQVYHLLEYIMMGVTTVFMWEENSLLQSIALRLLQLLTRVGEVKR